VTENGVWYIGNIAHAPVISTPGAIGLLPEMLSAAGMHERHVLHRPAGDLAAAGEPELVRHEIGPARAVGEIGAALARGADREALGPALAVLRGRGAGGRDDDRGGGDVRDFHVILLLSDIGRRPAGGALSHSCVLVLVFWPGQPGRSEV
jgi:hypothetical protein